MSGEQQEQIEEYLGAIAQSSGGHDDSGGEQTISPFTLIHYYKVLEIIHILDLLIFWKI
jgi:hypothetical protein